MRFRSILCPVDFSTHSRHALRYAAAIAHRFDSRVTAMFVTDPLLLAAASSAYGGRRNYLDRTRAELARFVKQSMPAAPSTAPTQPEPFALIVSVGNPADDILRQARRLKSDLIVIGTGGLTGVRQLFFGSTTEQVLRRTTLPVLAIPPSAGRRTDTASMTIRRVLAPIDLSGEWQSDAIRAANIARTFGAELTLVHVLAPVQAPPWLRTTVGRADRRRADTATKALERVRSEFPASLRSTSLVLTGNPADEIAGLASSTRSLLVMSLRGTAGVWGARRGSIAYHVLTHASTPLLALPRRRIGGRFRVRLARALTAILSERDRMEIAGIDALISAASSRPPRG